METYSKLNKCYYLFQDDDYFIDIEIIFSTSMAHQNSLKLFIISFLCIYQLVILHHIMYIIHTRRYIIVIIVLLYFGWMVFIVSNHMKKISDSKKNKGIKRAACREWEEIHIVCCAEYKIKYMYAEYTRYFLKELRFFFCGMSARAITKSIFIYYTYTVE